MRFAGFGIRGYRSFGGDMVYVGPLGKINLIAGINNVGKSNVLTFAELVLKQIHTPPPGPITPWNELNGPLGATSNIMQVALPISTEPDDLVAIAAGGPRPLTGAQAFGISQALQSDIFRNDDGVAWVPYRVETNGGSSTVSFALDTAHFRNLGDHLSVNVLDQLGEASNVLANVRGDAGSNLEHVLRVLRPLDGVPKVESIGAFRRVRSRSEGGDNHDGLGLIERLAELDRPDARQLVNREKFDAVTRFVRTVLDDETVNLEVPHHRQSVNVERGGRLLPLENLGTGIHEVIILAAAATVLDDHLICVEEPEIHLHPTLQRKLLKYLNDETTNQYLIATHSAHILDTSEASVFHATMTDGNTHLRLVAEPNAHARVCADLGLRASDLLQANAVVWVEGPSDRIYVRGWLSEVAPDLIEGVHYSLMFYGGRLLSHLSGEDPDEEEVKDFISLRRLNRNSHIVIDSDRTSEADAINATKMRVVNEFAPESIAWVTAGYTIENYLPSELLAAAIEACHPGKSPLGEDKYANPLGKGLDKVRIARAAIDLWNTPVNEWPLDLAKHVGDLAEAIRQANGLPTVRDEG